MFAQWTLFRGAAAAYFALIILLLTPSTELLMMPNFTVFRCSNDSLGFLPRFFHFPVIYDRINYQKTMC